MLKILQPPGWAEPKGYANGVVARGAFVAIGGQIGWNAAQAFGPVTSPQARGAREHRRGARRRRIVRMTWYVVDRDSTASLPRSDARTAGDRSPLPAMTAVE
jgi:enamine deaminase RidA (YjgF/YER057c/UK114 family)